LVKRAVVAGGEVREIETARGQARVHVDVPSATAARGLLVLGHGAGGGPEAPDLLAARDGALAAGFAIARVEQPWRVAGKRVASPPAWLDEAFLSVVGHLPVEGPLVLGGRSSGARVACRTATALDAAAVIALAFPLVPPGRTTSRADELALPSVPRFVVQGSRDAFGMPSGSRRVRVHVVEGADHSFGVRKADGRSRKDVLTEVGDVIRDWLQTVT
jgi:predicted alpha/beta-hydrolase family hydrolase